MSAVTQCVSIKSKKNQTERCPNPAKDGGEFCGHHRLSAVRWISPVAQVGQVTKIQNWYRQKMMYRNIHFHGLGFYNREACVNSEDFFSTESLKDISNNAFYSFRDASENLLYAFDIRSLHMLTQKSTEKNEPTKNPYTRSVIPVCVLNKARRLIEWRRARKMELSWVPTVTITPEQGWRMKVVEIFVMMEELQYGADPEWFIALSLTGQKRFYLNLLDIWQHRAGLSQEDRERIVPSPQQLFHWGITRITAIQQLSTIRTTNSYIMKKMITSAVDRSDKVLGAMYILTALTQVSPEAAEAFPWLFESAADSQQWVTALIAQIHAAQANIIV
jgi:hypothetical protein